LPIQGDDPRSERGRKVFSAAVLRSGEQKVGYIYVILQSEEHDRLAARATASSVLRTTLWSMAVVAALVLAAGLIAFRLITRPLHRLTTTMQQLDTQADQLVLPEPQRGGPRDEIAILEQSFRRHGGAHQRAVEDHAPAGSRPPRSGGQHLARPAHAAGLHPRLP
jgi:HAMP domain-containing protein